MEVFTRFLYAFLSQVFLGFTTMLKGLWNGIKQLFDIKIYQEIINTYISADENYEKVFDDETFSIYIKK